MPCSDHTEELLLCLDRDERIVNYQLSKKTCGRTVGGAVLLPYVFGVSWMDLLQTDRLERLVPADKLDKTSSHKQFLMIKQFLALHTALLVHTGQASGRVEDLFQVEDIEYGPEGTWIKGFVAVDRLKDADIPGCKHCGSGGCG